MEEPRKESVEEPTTTEEEAREADSFMVKEWTSIAVASIGAMLLFALVLLQATGLADFLTLFGDEPVEWLAVGAVAVLVLAVFAWSRRGI